MPQTTIKYLQDRAFEGMVADTVPRVIRGTIELFVADVDIPYGRIVVRKTAGSNILTLPSATGQKAVGIAVATEFYGFDKSQFLTGTGYPGYPAGAQLNILTWGDAWVYAAEAVAVDDPVYFNYKNGTSADDLIGRFRKAAVATQTDAYANARFIQATTAAGLALVNIGGF